MKFSLIKNHNTINLFFSILFFIILQLLIFDYVFLHIFHSSYSIYLLSILFLLSCGFYFYKINGFYLFSLLPLSIATYISYKYPENLYVFFIYIIFVIYVFYIFKRDYTNIAYNKYEPDIYIIISFIVFSIFVVSLIFYIKEYLIVLDRKTIKWYLCLRGSGEHINLIFHNAFDDWKRLFVPLLFLMIIFLLNFLILKRIIKKEIYIITILIFITFISKFVIARLSDKDIKVINEKIESKHNCSYYYFANNYRNNISDFIKDYTSIHQKARDNGHIRGHPVLPVLLYWLINRFISSSPFVAGIVIAGISSLTIIPIFYLIKFFSKNIIAAYFGGLFYALSANSAILSIAGIDSIITLFLALTIYFYMMGLNNNKRYLFFISGIFFGINSYFTFGLWHLIPFLFLYYFIFENNIQKIFDRYLIKNFLIVCFYFIIGIILFHLFFYFIFKGSYNYIESFKIAKLVHNDIMSGRPYEIWVWLNFIHWSLYISIGLIVLYLFRYLLALTGKIKMDSFSLLSFVIMLIQFISCTSRAETHRMWMFLIIFIIPVAILTLINKQNKIHQFYANIFSVLIFINSILIEIFITDAH